MEKDIKVSIITVCLNSEKTIRRTIESVLHQTYRNIEYIIVDGESKDNTLKIIKEYVPRFYGRLKIISEIDKGIYDAMNKGIKLSTGSLLGIINSDDFYEIDAVENIIRNMNPAKYQVLYGYCSLIYKGKVISINKNSHQKLNIRMIPHPTCFVTRETYKKFGLFLTFLKIASDYELMFRFYKSGQVLFTQIPKVIANFQEGGISTRIEVTERKKLEKAWIWHHYGEISTKEWIKSMLGFLIYI